MLAQTVEKRAGEVGGDSSGCESEVRALEFTVKDPTVHMMPTSRGNVYKLLIIQHPLGSVGARLAYFLSY